MLKPDERAHLLELLRPLQARPCGWHHLLARFAECVDAPSLVRIFRLGA